MLKTLITTLALLFSLSALACFKVDGSLSVDGETFKFSQKIDQSKEYKFPFQDYILSFTVKESSKKTKVFTYKIEEKKGITLSEVSKGEEEIDLGRSNDVFAKGEEGKPNSIITIKLIKL